MNLPGEECHRCNTILELLEKADVVKILPAKTVRSNRAAEEPDGQLGTGVLRPLKDEGKPQLRAVETASNRTY